MQKQIFKNITIQGITENSLVLFLVGNFDKCHCMEASVRKGRLLRGPREPSVAEIPHSE